MDRAWLYADAMSIRVLEDLTPELAELFRESGRFAVDTETSGLDWRVDRLEICQLYSPRTGSVIVRNSSRRPERLASVLESSTAQSVFHFAPFDLRFLEKAWGIRASAVRCTKTASRVADPELPNAEHSLKPLLQRRLGIHLDKGAVRTSDWGAVELSAQQIEYAIGDVRHLLDLHDDITPHLSPDQNALYEAMCEYLPSDTHREIIGIPNPLVH